MDRKKRLLLNTITSLILQGITFICGFILPRLILTQYGSAINGLVQSINQFLNVITFLELGVGAVIQSSLYKPLAESDVRKVSEIVTSGQKFFRKIAAILALYVCVLVIVYPNFVSTEFDWLFTSLLIISISISSFAQYYFGIIDKLFLNSDQKGYIQYISQIITVVANTIVSVILIKINASIQIVKLSTSIIYLIRPFVIRIYINKHYAINRNAIYEREPINQKWNGIAQHVAAIVLDNTDAIVLTLFSTLSNVSIYSVYQMIVYGVKLLFQSVTAGVQALIGDMLAKNEIDNLNLFFQRFEFVIHICSVFIFTVTAVLITPFVMVYTNGITDVDYYQPLFGMLIVAANGLHCLRIPYSIVIIAAGHYKQTQRSYVVAAVLNIIISVIAVNEWGLIGVAIGTVVSMTYQTIWMAIYDSKHIIKWPFRNFLKHLLVDAISVALILLQSALWRMENITYISWLVLAIKQFIFALFIVCIVNAVFYPSISHYWFCRIKNRVLTK